MANWFQNIFGNSKHHQSRSHQIPEPEFKPAKLPPRKSETPEINIQEIKDEAPRIMISEPVESSFDLQHFEVQISPHEFRFAMARNAEGLIAYKPHANSPCHTHLLQMKSPANVEPAFATLHLLLKKNEIFETPMHNPEKVFQSDTRDVPSVHLRFRYIRRNWHSWYLMNEIPLNIQTLLNDCHQLAIQITSGPKQRLSREQIKHRF